VSRYRLRRSHASPRALRLSRAERAYSSSLPEKTDPQSGANDAAPLRAPLLACVRGIAWPAYILDRYWNAAAGTMRRDRFSSAGSTATMTAISALHFPAPAAPRADLRFDDRANRRARRIPHRLQPHLDDRTARFGGRSSAREPRIRPCLDPSFRHPAGGGRRTFAHPSMGPLSLDQLSFALAGHSDVKLGFRPGGGPDGAKLNQA